LITEAAFIFTRDTRSALLKTVHAPATHCSEKLFSSQLISILAASTIFFEICSYAVH